MRHLRGRVTVVLPQALQRLLATRPQLQVVRSAAEALGLQRHQLLHAGPPLRDPTQPPPALASAVVLACLHAGWAPDAAAAEELLRSGALQLSPAQDRGCVTPLVAVVAPDTPLFGVGDAAVPHAVWAPVPALRGPDLRMGTRDPAVLARLQQRDRLLVPALQHALQAGPLPLWPLAAAGLAAGDDLHSRTTAANAALVDALLQRGLPPALADDIAATPLFFLTPWMAACALQLRAAEQGDCPTLVTRAGGNGERFAIALAGRPGAWIGCDATAPQGLHLPQVAADLAVTGAVGDSAVIDLLGLGGQRLGLAPEPWSALGNVVAGAAAAGAAAATEAARRLLCAPQPLLAEAWPLGTDAARVVAQAQAPWVALAMVAADGRSGFVGRGVYRPPLALFAAACEALSRPAGAGST